MLILGEVTVHQLVETVVLDFTKSFVQLCFFFAGRVPLEPVFRCLSFMDEPRFNTEMPLNYGLFETQLTGDFLDSR